MIIKYGDKGDEVRDVQRKLRRQGFFFDGDPQGNFGPLTLSGVVDFQFCHLGPDGDWLEADGIVGPNTMWALDNPSGNGQRSWIDATIPGGLTLSRKIQLETALKYWRLNVHEIPDGSNHGDGVDQFITGYGSVAWCMLFVSQCDIEANGYWTLGKREASTYRAWQEAKARNIYYDKREYEPIPGDWFLMQYRDKNGNLKGTGHVGFVLRVSEDGLIFQTVEGNAGNRVKVGERKLSQSSLIGFVNIWGQAGDCAFERGLSPRFKSNVTRTI